MKMTLIATQFIHSCYMIQLTGYKLILNQFNKKTKHNCAKCFWS